MCLCTAKANSKSSHHFIKNQYRTICCTFGTQGIVKFLGRNNHVHVASDWLNNHASNLLAPFLKAVFDRLWVIIRQRNRMLSKVSWNAF